MGISPNVALSLVALAAVAIAGCDVPGSAPTDPVAPLPAQQIEFQGASVRIGDTLHVNVQLYRASSTGNEMIDRSLYTFTSTRPAIVAMLSFGYAVAIGAGVADVIVSAPGAADARFPIQVVAAPEDKDPPSDPADHEREGSEASGPAESPESVGAPGDAGADGAEPAGATGPTETGGDPAGSGAEEGDRTPPPGGTAAPAPSGDQPTDAAGDPAAPAGENDLPLETGTDPDPADGAEGVGGHAPAEPTAPAPTAPEVVADVHVRPGDDIVSLVNGAASGDVIYLHGHPDGRGHTYDIGGRVLTLPNRATLRGPTARRGSNGEIDAPVRIRGSGRQVFNQQNRTDWLIEHLDISGARFVSDRNQDGVGINRGSGTVRFVKIHDNDNKGLGGWAGLLEYSELTNNAAAQLSGYSAASKSIYVHTIRHSYVHHNHYYALWTDCDNRGWTVEDNVVIDNFGSGLFNEISRGPTLIARNRVERNNLGNVNGRAGVVVTSSRNVRLTGNTIIGNGVVDLRVWDDRRAGNGPAGCQSGYHTENVRVMEDNRIGSR